ncbi:MAG TPA: histidine kinase [Longimicrobium sp.]|uniref:sensor histidine kinase n=1 Tax=Longimicrobium sp. TaxID=2029185 RepID=UPI002EDB8CBF
MPPLPPSTSEPVPAPSGNRRLLWASVVCAWTLMAVIDTTQLGFYYRDHEPHLGWINAMERAVPSWAVWALLTPVVFAVAARVPLERGNLRRVLPLHLVAALALVSVWALAVSAIAIGLGWPAAGGHTWGTLVERYLPRRLHVNLLIYAALVGVHHALEYHRRLQEREAAAAELRTRLAQAQLQSLRTQLQPHFLFNTLNAVSVLALKGETQAVVRMLSRLSELLRLTLDGAPGQEVTLRRELAMLERYVDIERVRFPDRLEVRVDAAPETYDALVPALLLQPLVENAIRHGIAQTVGAGRVQVRAERRGDRLWMEVRDTGPGFPPAGVQREGIGLANVSDRLACLYGEEGRFTLENAPEGGAVVTVEVPFRTAETGAEPGAHVPDEVGR